MKETLALIASVIALIGYVPYLRGIIKGTVRPHPYTWLLWSVVTGITLAGQLVSGAGAGSWPTLISEILTVCIFLFALRYGFHTIARVDNIFLVIALLGLIPWYITKDPTISVIIAVGIDLVAFMPTFRKTWQAPHSENAGLYGANVVKHTLSLMALQSYNIPTTLHSIAMLATNLPMVLVIIFRKQRITKKPSAKPRKRR